MNIVNIKNVSSIMIKYWPCYLILLAFIGFISKALYNYPIGIMALIGLYQFISAPKNILADKTLKLFSLIFLCFWLPLLLSFPDAVNPKHSAHTLFPYLRFFFAGLFIITELNKQPARINVIIVSLYYIVLFWCVDATIQFIFNQDLFGFPYKPGDITGMFYPRNTISHICAILSAFLYLHIHINYEKNKYLALSILPLFFILLLSGRRAAWVMLALTSFAFVAYEYIYSINRKRFLKYLSMISVAIVVLLSSTIIFHAPTNNKFKTTMGLFSGDYERINAATSTRLPIWETSLAILKAHPINGIGPRGFRHVYKDYAAEDDYFVKTGHVPTQPHIILLEIITETGLIGLAGYIIALYLIICLLLKSNNKQKLLPFFIPVIVAMFPLNAHMAFYGSIWSSMFWLLLALYFAESKRILNHG